MANSLACERLCTGAEARSSVWPTTRLPSARHHTGVEGSSLTRCHPRGSMRPRLLSEPQFWLTDPSQNCHKIRDLLDISDFLSVAAKIWPKSAVLCSRSEGLGVGEHHPVAPIQIWRNRG